MYVQITASERKVTEPLPITSDWLPKARSDGNWNSKMGRWTRTEPNRQPIHVYKDSVRAMVPWAFCGPDQTTLGSIREKKMGCANGTCSAEDRRHAKGSAILYPCLRNTQTLVSLIVDIYILVHKILYSCHEEYSVHMLQICVWHNDILRDISWNDGLDCAVEESWRLLDSNLNDNYI